MRLNSIEDFGLFSLFHHDVSELEVNGCRVRPAPPLADTCEDRERQVRRMGDCLLEMVSEAICTAGNGEVSLTLTGGMDSRVILACLLNLGCRPNCVAYGVKNAKDVVFARGLAEQFKLPFHNPSNPEPDANWYGHWVKKVVELENGNAHLHRAHRLAAIAKHSEAFGPKILFTGHMGGEGLRGLTYNDYFASSFFENVNEGTESVEECADRVLRKYFIRCDRLDWDKLINRVNKLPFMGHDAEQNKFHFLMELVGRIHHRQDIRLYQHYIPSVFPVYLQEKYLDTLFSTDLNFMRKPSGLRGRLANPRVHTELLRYLYPRLMQFPLSNGYTPREYELGVWFGYPMAMVRRFSDGKKYSPTFSYGKWFVDFVKERSQEISDEIWDIYDKELYFAALKNETHRTGEGYWHRFSNPIFFDWVKKNRSQTFVS